jgi:PAS domain S-box-containing protein
MVDNRNRLRKQNLSMILVSLSLIGCIAVLLYMTYTSQLSIEGFALDQLRQDAEKRAGAVSYFYMERRNDLTSLAEQRSLSTFFENQALGMSMQYGLKDSLFAMAEQFGRLIDGKQLVGRSIYTRVLFKNNDGTTLAERALEDLDDRDAVSVPPASPGDMTDAAIRLLGDRSIVTIPYFFKGTQVGRIVGVIAADAAYDYLLRTDTSFSKRTLAVTSETGQLLYVVSGHAGVSIRSIERDLDEMAPGVIRRIRIPGDHESGMEVIGIRVLIQDTPLYLVSLAPVEEILSGLPPARLLFLMTTVCCLIFGGMLLVTRINTRKFVLQARLDETAKSRRVLKEKNELLQKEIAERLRVEESLRTSEERFSTFMSHLPAAVFIKDQEGRLLFANQFLRDLFGWQDCIGKTTAELLPKELASNMVADDGKALSQGLQVFVESVCSPLGVKRVFETHKFPVRTGLDNTLLGGISLDITERKAAEEVLRLTQFSVEHAADPIYWIGPEARIVYANQAASRSLGYTKEELFSLYMTDIDPSISLEKWPAFWEQTKERGVLAFESAHRRKDGTTFPIDVSFNNMAFDGREFSFLCARDISESKRAESVRLTLEARLKQAQKMEAIGTLAGGIAHDFNNILAAIIGYTEMAVADLSEHSPMRLDLEQVLKAGYRARDLVKQILVFSRMRSGETFQRVHVGRIVEEAMRFLRASLPATVEIRQNIKVATGMTLADPTQIHELVINLCTNAAHAMEEKGGVLEVTLTDVYLDSSLASLHPGAKPGPYLRLTVADTGHGMDEETMEHIFEPYFTTKEVGKGTGFGLAVVHGIVRRHGGAITVQSEPGKGAAFNVHLPVIEGDGSVDHETEGPIPCGNERILLVDDEEMLANMVEMMLARLGYSVLTQTSSVEALNVFRKRPFHFDLVVTDYTMPQMTGADLAREILAVRSDIPIILCTGYSERISEEKAREIGIEQFLMKPLNRRSLATTVRKVLDKPRH